MQVNMFEAKTNLSKLVKLLEERTESEIVLARDGEPVARLLLFSGEADVSKRIGIAPGVHFSMSQEEFDACNDEIAAMFYGEEEGDEE